MDARIGIGVVAGALLLGVYYVEGVLDSDDAAKVSAMTGPEALTWLRESKDESALASNRFPTTQDAIRFVRQLYDKGALRVIVPDETIRDDGVEIYADALVVTLPSEQPKRDAVWKMCAQEIKRQGEKAGDRAAESHVFLWWD
ncbi:MAG TPA: hypothetical protein VGX76_05715 [Pirellulales bacterium]|nr:hypothetical protein [Pirellulales bacterium]